MDRAYDIGTAGRGKHEAVSDPPGRSRAAGHRRRHPISVIWSAVRSLVVTAAFVIVLSHFLMPVLHIYGQSMNGTLEEGDIVLAVKFGTASTGEIIGFYYNNQILVKRVIGNEGDQVDIDEDGAVYLNGVKLSEPYVNEASFGECDTDLPCLVPEDRLFVLGDNRRISIDSRSTAIGCVAEDLVLGKIVFRIWPLQRIGPVK